MELREMIYRRKSVRSYTGVPLSEDTIQKIQAFSEGIKPLYPDIKTHMEIVERETVKCICPWTTPQLAVFFCEDKDGALENVGFIYQQLELYIQSLGLGSCWLGMGRLDPKADIKPPEGMKFAMMLAFGQPKGDAVRNDISEFKRKKLSEISDREDERLEPARLAPSSVNSQPWYFTHEGDVIHAYCGLSGFFRKKSASDINLIDMGIALAHLCVSYPDSFRFFKADAPAEINGYIYIGSFKI